MLAEDVLKEPVLGFNPRQNITKEQVIENFKESILIIAVQPSGMARAGLCLHKEQPAPFLMSGAPEHEQRSGKAAGSAKARLCEWRGLNCQRLRIAVQPTECYFYF